MKHLMQKLASYKGAMDRTTSVQKTAAEGTDWWLRFAITPFALLAELVSDLADKVGESEEIEAVKAFVENLGELDLFVSFPVNLVTDSLALPNTGRGIVWMGATSKKEGGVVIFPRLTISVDGIERLLSLEAAHEAAEALSQQISDEMKRPVSVNLEAKIAARQIQVAENAQTRDAKDRAKARRDGYQPAQRGNRGARPAASGTSDQPAFAGPSGGDEPDIPGL